MSRKVTGQLQLKHRGVKPKRPSRGLAFASRSWCTGMHVVSHSRNNHSGLLSLNNELCRAALMRQQLLGHA
jgi:hypothetical protein